MLKPMRQSVILYATVIVAISVVTGACASAGRAGIPVAGLPVPQPFPMPSAPRIQPSTPVPTETPGVDGYALAGMALSLRGAPYRNGGADPQGFDCSGFTQYVFARYGVALPREVRDQFQQGKSVKADELAVGDLLFFTTVAPGATHVGIAIGGDQFIHAPSSTGVVRVERLSTSYWSTRFVGARRVG
jgi:NlpC/P60 family